jgi:hypothetical protein
MKILKEYKELLKNKLQKEPKVEDFMKSIDYETEIESFFFKTETRKLLSDIVQTLNNSKDIDKIIETYNELKGKESSIKDEFLLAQYQNQVDVNNKKIKDIKTTSTEFSEKVNEHLENVKTFDELQKENLLTYMTNNLLIQPNNENEKNKIMTWMCKNKLHIIKKESLYTIAKNNLFGFTSMCTICFFLSQLQTFF